jgi:hypothetical protein
VTHKKSSAKLDKDKLPTIYHHVNMQCQGPLASEHISANSCGRMSEHILTIPIDSKRALLEWAETAPPCPVCGSRQALSTEKHICYIDGCYNGIRLVETAKPPLHFLCEAHSKYVRKELIEALKSEPPNAVRQTAVRTRTLSEVVFLCYGGGMAKPYIEDAERWRYIAHVRGEGDPLETLSKLPLRTK